MKYSYYPHFKYQDIEAHRAYSVSLGCLIRELEKPGFNPVILTQYPSFLLLFLPVLLNTFCATGNTYIRRSNAFVKCIWGTDMQTNGTQSHSYSEGMCLCAVGGKTRA